MNASPRNSNVQKLLVLTLAIEDAVKQEAWGEVDDLYQARAAVLEVLFQDPELTSEDLAPVLQADERLHQLLDGLRAEVLDMLRKSHEIRAAAARYRQPGFSATDRLSA